ncbi:hypothetical protein BSL78_19114 [Apostichopus japonicus]|uniref:Uncharacterized protein n=1 Tax=Stichopus japonicus TaxID=307972 RepID=A0A2G8K7P3_STIJA|nr:hypothetical protein BSL78_19114 [Apostichopus japonicus]
MTVLSDLTYHKLAYASLTVACPEEELQHGRVDYRPSRLEHGSERIFTCEEGYHQRQPELNQYVMLVFGRQTFLFVLKIPVVRMKLVLANGELNITESQWSEEPDHTVPLLPLYVLSVDIEQVTRSNVLLDNGEEMHQLVLKYHVSTKTYGMDVFFIPRITQSKEQQETYLVMWVTKPQKLKILYVIWEAGQLL